MPSEDEICAGGGLGFSSGGGSGGCGSARTKAAVSRRRSAEATHEHPLGIVRDMSFKTMANRCFIKCGVSSPWPAGVIKSDDQAGCPIAETGWKPILLAARA